MIQKETISAFRHLVVYIYIYTFRSCLIASQKYAYPRIYKQIPMTSRFFPPLLVFHLHCFLRFSCLNSFFATSAQLFIGCSEGILLCGFVVAFGSPPPSPSSSSSYSGNDLCVIGDDITEGDSDKPGLGGGGGVEGRLRSRSLLVGRAPQSITGPSPAVDTRLTIGLF